MASAGRAGCALLQQREVGGGGVAGSRNNGWILFLEVTPDVSVHMLRIKQLFDILSNDISKSTVRRVIFVVVSELPL